MSLPSEEGKDNTTKDATNQKGDNQYNDAKSNVHDLPLWENVAGGRGAHTDVEGRSEGVEIMTIIPQTVTKGDIWTITANVAVGVKNEAPAQDRACIYTYHKVIATSTRGMSKKQNIPRFGW
jgi:hypothetical protein